MPASQYLWRFQVALYVCNSGGLEYSVGRVGSTVGHPRHRVAHGDLKHSQYRIVSSAAAGQNLAARYGEEELILHPEPDRGEHRVAHQVVGEAQS